jgi:hypothetical protein
VRYADAQTQLELKKEMLGVEQTKAGFEAQKAGADIQNQKAQRREEAAKALEGRGAWRRLLDVITPTGRSSTAAFEKELTGEPEQTMQITSSDGGTHTIYAKNLQAAKQRDPGLKVNQ